jgi:flagellar hook assembly protein FlgD
MQIKVFKSSFYTISVIDILGKEIKKLFNGNLDAGMFQFEWNGLDKNGRTCASGIYYCRVENNKKVLTNKWFLLK